MSTGRVTSGPPFGRPLRQSQEAGSGENPFIDPEGYRRFVSQEKGKYLERLAAEKARAR